MRRVAFVLGAIALVVMCSACGGGDNGTPEVETGPLVIEVLTASPAQGNSPLKVTFTVVISGGKGPFYYAWDFNNDGSVDRYDNAQFNRTLSVETDFLVRASDGELSEYEAVLAVTDSENTSVTSDPLVIEVSPAGIPVLSLNIATESGGDALPYPASFDSGAQVFYNAEVTGGTSPYTFHWNFDYQSQNNIGLDVAADPENTEGRPEPGGTYVFEPNQSSGDVDYVDEVEVGPGETAVSSPMWTYYVSNTALVLAVVSRVRVVDSTGLTVLQRTDPFFIWPEGTLKDLPPAFEIILSTFPTATTESGAAGAGSTETQLQAPGADFLSAGVLPGMRIDNITDGSNAIVTAVTSATALTTTALVSGVDNTWTEGDLYRLGIVEIKFDPSGENENVPEEPELDLAVVVSPDPLKAGTPPYEYYWDFDNDGAYESQVPSPTIPYYSDTLKVFYNPYAHNQTFRVYVLRCTVIDSSGQLREAFRNIVSTNVAGRPPGNLEVEYTVNADGFGNPYAEVSGYDATTDVSFTVNVEGSTGTYQYKFDGNGDGTFEIPDAEDEDGWEDVAGAVINETLAFAGVGYFPAHMTIRAVDDQGSQVDILQLPVPVSLVERNLLSPAGTLKPRTDLDIIGTWSAIDGGGNDMYLEFRQVTITGGAQGDTPILDVELAKQTFNQPAGAGQHETQDEFTTETRFTLNQERRSHFAFSDVGNLSAGEFTVGTGNGPPTGDDIVPPPERDFTKFYVIGGENITNGPLGTVETKYWNDGVDNAWTPSSEIYLPPLYPLKDFSGVPLTDRTLEYEEFEFEGDLYWLWTFALTTRGFLFGGIHQGGSAENPNVSPKSLRYVWQYLYQMVTPPNDPNTVLDDQQGIGESTTDLEIDMITPRYDACAVLTGDKLYVLGGRKASGEAVTTVEALNINTGLWSLEPDMQDARAGFCCEIIGGNIYVLGGAYYPANEADKEMVTTAEVFNPLTGVWSYTLPPSIATDHAGSAALPGPGSVNDQGASVNTIWYLGGSRAGYQGECNDLQELIYFYTVLPEPPPTT